MPAWGFTAIGSRFIILCLWPRGGRPSTYQAIRLLSYQCITLDLSQLLFLYLAKPDDSQTGLYGYFLVFPKLSRIVRKQTSLPKVQVGWGSRIGRSHIWTILRNLEQTQRNLMCVNHVSNVLPEISCVSTRELVSPKCSRPDDWYLKESIFASWRFFN